MALVIKDRVLQTTNTTGTSDVVLSGSVSGYADFSGVGNGNTTFYCIVDSTNQWEAGLGTYTASTTTLSRDTVYANSLGNTSKITIAAGLSNVFLGMPAERMVYLDATGNVSTLGTVSSGVWNGTAVTTAYGGTGLTSFTAGDIVYYATGTTLSKLGIGTSGYVLKSNGSAPVWEAASNVAVTTFSAGTTGFTPSTATGGAVTLAGTLATTNGGTGLTSFTSGGAVYSTSTSALTTGTLPLTAGGTGATTVADAQTNLQVDPAGTAVAMAIALG